MSCCRGSDLCRAYLTVPCLLTKHLTVCLITDMQHIAAHCIEKQKPNTHPCAKLIEHIQRRSSPPFRRFDATYYHEYHHSTGRVVTRVLTPWDYQSKSRNNNNNNRHYHPYARPSSSRGGISKRGSSSSSSSSSRAYPLYCVSPQHAAFDRMP